MGGGGQQLGSYGGTQGVFNYGGQQPQYKPQQGQEIGGWKWRAEHPVMGASGWLAAHPEQQQQLQQQQQQRLQQQQYNPYGSGYGGYGGGYGGYGGGGGNTPFFDPGGGNPNLNKRYGEPPGSYYAKGIPFGNPPPQNFNLPPGMTNWMNQPKGPLGNLPQQAVNLPPGMTNWMNQPTQQQLGGSNKGPG